eukprot:1927913-Pyramimonas_sp.AAC.1
MGPDGVDSNVMEHFNRSLLFFLPNTASGAAFNGEGFYELRNVRPLNVTNTDNGLVANAMRILTGPIVGPRISAAQR